MTCTLDLRRSPITDKERIFDGRKNLKLTVQDALMFVCSFNASYGVSINESQSVALINRHKSSKSRRASNRSDCHHIPICHGLATWPNDGNLQWMLSTYTAPYSLHVPIFQHETRRFPSPILRIYLQGLSCLPWVSQMSHRLWEKRRYHRRKWNRLSKGDLYIKYEDVTI